MVEAVETGTQESPGVFGRIWNGIKAAVKGIPTTIIWSLGIFAASSAVHYMGGPDFLGADGLYNAGGIGGKLLTSLALGSAISFGFGALITPHCPPAADCQPCNTPRNNMQVSNNSPAPNQDIEMPRHLPAPTQPQPQRQV